METLILFAEINICLAAFALIYQLVLRPLTFYRWNRFYLLLSLIFSIVIPLSSIEVIRKGQNDIIQPVKTPYNLSGIAKPSTIPDLSYELNSEHAAIDWERTLLSAYLAISVFLLIHLFVIIFRIIRHSKGSTQTEGFRIVKPFKKFRNCSFFNILFIDIETISNKEFELIMRHEKEHTVRIHSADKILIELIRCLLWASPLIYYYRFVLDEVHEFDVDGSVSKTCNTQNYATFLLSLSMQGKVPLTNGVSSGPLTARIKMLFTKPSHKMKKTLYLLALPVIASLVLLFTVEAVYSSTSGLNQSAPSKAEVTQNALRNEKPLRIVLDPGHGGKDVGGKASAGIEKDIVLNAAIKLKALLEKKGTVVRLTRDADEFVSLRDRATTDPGKADMLISLHMQVSKDDNALNGMQIFYSDQQKNEETREKSLKLANVMFKNLLSHQTLEVRESLNVPSLMVLKTPEIPAVLLQLGYLTNKSDVATLFEPGRLELIANIIHQSGKELLASK